MASRHIRAALCGALLVLLNAGAAAAGPAPAGDDGASDGLYARFGDGERKGFVMIELLAMDRARLTTALTGLGTDTLGYHRIVGARVGCGSDVSRADRTFRVDVNADRDGGSFGVLYVGGQGGVFRSTKSVRIKEPSGELWGCRPAVAFKHCMVPSTVATAGDECTDPPPNGGYSRFRDGGRRGIVIFGQGGNDTITINVALTGLTGSSGQDWFFASASKAACDEPVTPGDRVFKIRFRANDAGRSFARRTADVSNAELRDIVSIRIRDSDGDPWGCRSTNIIATLVAL